MSFRHAMPGNGNAILEINLVEALNYRQWFTSDNFDTEKLDFLAFVLAPSPDGSQVIVSVQAYYIDNSEKYDITHHFSGITLSTVTIETETRETNEPSVAPAAESDTNESPAAPGTENTTNEYSGIVSRIEDDGTIWVIHSEPVTENGIYDAFSHSVSDGTVEVIIPSL